jgi:predicted small integral membrane protein
VIGAVFCVGMAVWMVSPRRDDRDDRGDGVLRFMDGRRWRVLQVVSGAALAGLGLLEVQRGNSEGWLMVAIAVVVVVATQAFLYFARRRRTR